VFGSCFFVGEKYGKLKEVLFDIIVNKFRTGFWLIKMSAQSPSLLPHLPEKESDIKE
jgi:hypothetical protein